MNYTNQTGIILGIIFLDERGKVEGAMKMPIFTCRVRNKFVVYLDVSEKQ